MSPHRFRWAFYLIVLAAAARPMVAWGDDDSSTDATSSLPTIYLDLNTAYTSVPPGVIAFGFGNFGNLLASDLNSLVPAVHAPAESPSLPGTRNLTINAPLTVDLTDWLSVWAGISGNSTSRTDSSTPTPWKPTTWNVGFSAEIIQQKGTLPKVTIQSTLTNPFEKTTFGLTATTLQTIVESNWAFNEDETRGILAGVQYTAVFASGPPLLNPQVDPAVIGYLGAYYQWPTDWKLTGRAGIQSFGGAQIGSLLQAKGFTQPVVRIDLDKVDDNDNRLFGVSAEVSWTPQPLFQITLRTPFYAVRNQAM